MKTKALKIWNGRGHGAKYLRGGHFYVCASSRRAAARLVCLAAYPECEPDERLVAQMDREINVYYSADCWGNAMKGIAMEEGVWATQSHNDAPKKIA